MQCDITANWGRASVHPCFFLYPFHFELTVLFGLQGNKKTQKKNKFAREVAAALISKEPKTSMCDTFKGLDAASVEMNKLKVSNCIAIQIQSEEAIPANLSDITITLVCPIPCKYCGYLRMMGELVPLECACEWYSKHSTRHVFHPKKRVVCGNCSTVRFAHGMFFACLCVTRVLEDCRQRCSFWM